MKLIALSILLFWLGFVAGFQVNKHGLKEHCQRGVLYVEGSRGQFGFAVGPDGKIVSCR